MLLRSIADVYIQAETFKPCVDGSHRAAEGARDLGFLHAFSDKSAERLIILRAPGLASVFSAAAFFAIELLYRVKVIEYELLASGLYSTTEYTEFSPRNSCVIRPRLRPCGVGSLVSLPEGS